MIINYDAVKAAGYNVQYVEDNVHIIENFIPAKDAQFLVSLGDKLTDAQWSESYMNNVRKHVLGSFGTDDFDLLEKEGKFSLNKYSLDKVVGLVKGELGPSGVDDRILEHASKICATATSKLDSFIYDKSKYELSPFFSMRRHYLDDGMPDHNDQKDSPKQRQSAVIYLNDDYNGGELYFRDQGIDLRPPAYSVAIFNNGIDYMHGVRTVLEGPTRYTLATFISVK